jgi:hypothetical protein
LKFAMLLIYNLEQNHHAPPKLATCTKVKRRKFQHHKWGKTQSMKTQRKSIVVLNLNSTQVAPQSPP